MRRSTISRLAALAGLVCAMSGADAAILHKNEFYFSTPDLSQPFYFTLKHYEVTKGQPWEGVSTSIDTAKHYAWIYVKSGRKNSTAVGAWFRSNAIVRLGSGLETKDMKFAPEDLNFAFRGDLTISANDTKLFCRDVYIGQGHQLIGNNWWVGGPNMRREDEGQRKMLAQDCEGGKAKFAVGGVGNNNFDLYVLGTDKAKRH